MRHAPADTSAASGELALTERAPLRLWVLAGTAALALHAAAFGATLLQPAEAEDGADLGASAIEVGIELATPRQEQTDLPPGPDTDASAASTASIQQEAKPEVQEMLPQEQPVEAADPDRVVTTQAPVEAKKEPDAQKAEQQSEAAADSVASEATAMPSMEAAKEAPVSTAPTLGVGESLVRVRTTWQRRLVAHLDRNKRYPPGETRRAVQTVVSFTINRTGNVVAADIATSSGDASFDQAALAMLRRADPLPAPPALVADEGLTFTVPVVFRAKGRG